MTMDFFIENRIYYHDTDSGGVTYYGRYLEHLEESRAEFFRSKGIDLAEYGRNGVLFPVVHLEIDYKSPARYGDVIRIGTALGEIGNASIHFSQEIRRGDTLLIAAKSVWACVDANLKPRRIPEEVRRALGGKT